MLQTCGVFTTISTTKKLQTAKVVKKNGDYLLHQMNYKKYNLHQKD